MSTQSLPRLESLPEISSSLSGGRSNESLPFFQIFRSGSRNKVTPVSPEINTRAFGAPNVVYDLGPPPEVAVRERKWGRWVVRALGLIGSAGCVGIRAADLSRYSNVVGCFGAGFLAPWVVMTGLKGQTAERVRGIALTIFGQYMMFVLSQIYANTKDEQVQIAMTHTIIMLFGMNISLIAGWLMQKGALRIEPYQLPIEEASAGESRKCDYFRLFLLAKAVASVAVFGSVSVFSTDPSIKAIFSFFSAFTASQFFGEQISDRLDSKIKLKDIDTRGLPLTERRNRWRKCKTGLMTSGMVFQPITFIPFNNIDNADHFRRVILMGIGLGFFNGFSAQSQSRRMERISPEHLEEFQKLDEIATPKDCSSKKQLCRYTSWKAWKTAVPTLAISGIIAFTCWQEVSELKKNDARLALGAMAAGFLGSYLMAEIVDRVWKPEMKKCLPNFLFKKLWVSPRFLGIDPLFVYFAVTNALQMDGSSISNQDNSYRLALIFLAWAAYGSTMGRELKITSSDRVGNPYLKEPQLALINGAATTVFALGGSGR